MAHDQIKAVKGGPTQKHLYSRISYLYQAATYLAQNASSQHDKTASYNRVKMTGNSDEEKDGCDSPIQCSGPSAKEDLSNTGGVEGRKQSIMYGDGLSLFSPSPVSPYLLNHLGAVCRKGQIRLTPDIKHSICKWCDTLLIPSVTSTKHVENNSRDGKRAWADVLVMSCMVCGTAKRFPVGAKRQSKKQKRPHNKKSKSVAMPKNT